MRRDQIGNMDVIADTVSIGSWVIRPKDRNIPALSQRYAQNQRDQVGLRLMSFPASGQSTAGIEVAQGRKMHAVDLPVPIQNLFDHQLGMTVHIGWAER